MAYTFRTLRPDEVGKWLDFMCNEIFPDDPREAVESMWTDDPIKDVTGIFVAVDDHDDIIASVKSACKGIIIRGVPIKTAIISGVGTRRDHRGQGLNARLFDVCCREMLARGARISHLYSNPDTLEFYLRMGYAALPQRPGEDFFRMYRLLAPFTLGDSDIPTTQNLLDLL